MATAFFYAEGDDGNTYGNHVKDAPDLAAAFDLMFGNAEITRKELRDRGVEWSYLTVAEGNINELRRNRGTL